MWTVWNIEPIKKIYTVCLKIDLEKRIIWIFINNDILARFQLQFKEKFTEAFVLFRYGFAKDEYNCNKVNKPSAYTHWFR